MNPDLLFEQMTDLIVARDSGQNIQLVNAAFVHAFGQSADEWVGQKLDASMAGAQTGAFDENRAYGYITIARRLYWIEWVETELADGGSLSVGRLNADRRVRNRTSNDQREDRRRNRLIAFQKPIDATPNKIGGAPKIVQMLPTEPEQIAPSLAPVQRSAAAPEARPALQILLAEDDLLNAKLARTLLERTGCVVTHVENGWDAVEAARRQTFDLVFMDIRMPKMDGLSAARAIRALGGAWTDIPIVALTANAFAEDKKACHQAGMDGFLTKPISVDALNAAQKHWTNQSEKAKTA
ncbi:MAG: hypothetical protein COA47_00880 [Robiginitomaculum sp.]|nr:MAG: hypothetical protein COA47_00880 [Robiginitomaculum sp.]